MSLEPKTPLPPIKHFQLDYILKHVLADESNQTAESFRQLAKKYRKDLKTEIRVKLSIEQKLQNKNIQIAKLANQIDHDLQKQIKSITKSLGKQDENNLDSEVMPVVKLTEDVTVKFKAIMGRLGNVDLDKYPLLKQYRQGTVSSQPATTATAATTTVSTTTRSTASDAQTVAPRPKSASPSFSPVNSPSVSLPVKSESPFDSADPMDPEDFEKFMASALSNYRKQQSHRYSSDVFNSDEPLFRPPVYDHSLASSYHKSENPINLLYIESTPKSPVISKSPAIALETSQSTHFKKLRINGSPITSSTKQPCKCQTKEPHNHQPMSPTINSDDEHVFVEPIIVSASSDSDSDDSDDLTDATNQYYTSLHRDYQTKKKKLKRRLARQLQLSNQVRDSSPTPKHEPSHHLLKPKQSILKITTQHLRQPSIPRKKSSKLGVKGPIPKGSPLLNGTMLPKTAVDLPKDNMAFPLPSLALESPTVDESLVNGIIVESETTHSINKLRSLIP